MISCLNREEGRFNLFTHKFLPLIDGEASPNVCENGDRPEWHLLKLFGMPIFSDILARDRSRLGE